VIEIRYETCIRKFFSEEVSMWQTLVVLEQDTGLTYCLIPLEQNYSASLVSSCKIVSGVIELDRRNDIGCAR
jgi:hypothetical protein